MKLCCTFAALHLLAAAPARATEDRPEAARPGAADTLAGEVRLAALVRLALMRNPAVTAERSRAASTVERESAAGRLPDLEVKYELWAVPLSSPLAYHRAMMHMLGLRQMFPAPGSRAAEADAARQETGQARELLRAAGEDLVAAVRTAFAEHQRLEEEYRLQLEHLTVSTRLQDIVSSAYRAGRGTIQDQLRVAVEISRLDSELAVLEHQRRASTALINTLVRRPPDAPLGRLVPEPLPRSEPSLPQLERGLDANVPALRAAAREIERTEAVAEGSRMTARWPSVMVGLDYMNMPLEHDQHAYGGMLSFNLPWLNPARAASARAAERSHSAARSALDSARNTVVAALRGAAARYGAAAYQVQLADRDLIPQARKSFEAAQAAYTGGGSDLTTVVDALRMLIQARIDRVRTAARLQMAAAEVDRAAGVGLAAAGVPEFGRL